MRRQECIARLLKANPALEKDREKVVELTQYDIKTVSYCIPTYRSMLKVVCGAKIADDYWFDAVAVVIKDNPTITEDQLAKHFPRYSKSKIEWALEAFFDIYKVIVPGDTKLVA